MKTYKTPSNELYAFELDGSQDHLIRSDMVQVSDEEADAIRAALVPPITYTSITPRQIRQVLTLSGHRAQVEALVAAGDQDLRDWWEFALFFERSHPVLNSMAASLGLTDSDVDALFMQAGSL